MNTVQTYTTTMKEMEARKVEENEIEIDGKTYNSLFVHFDNENGDRLVFKDKCVENKERYQRGTIGTLTLQISTENIIKTAKNGKPYITEKTSVTIKDFTPSKK